jgi:hypothetical protein
MNANNTAMRNYLIAGLGVLKSEAENQPISSIVEERFEFGEDSFGTIDKPITLFRAFVRHRRRLLEALPETAIARKTLLDQGTVYSRSRQKTATNDTEIDDEVSKRVTELLNIFVTSYLEHYETFEITDPSFEEHLLRFRSVWQSDQVTHIVTVPLLAFHSMGRIDLEQNLAIGPLTTDVKSDLWRPDVLGGPTIAPWDFAMAKFAVIGKYTSASPWQGDHTAITPKIQRVLLAMRLVKAGDVYAEVAFDTLEYAYLSPIRTTTPQDNLRASRRVHNDYVLDQDEVPTLLALYSMLGDDRIGAPLEVATSRFQQTYSRDRAEDRVIDLTIGLESMLLYDVRAELGFRLSLRGATLLADCVPADYSFSLLKALYNARSKIVHEGATLRVLSRKKGLIGNLGVDCFMTDVTEWVRTAIRRYVYRLFRGELPASIARSLDHEAIQGIGQRHGRVEQ